MKIRLIGCLLCVLLCLSGAASAQTLPSNDCFSPGLRTLAQVLADDPAVHMDAVLTVDDAFYVRDLSVLSQMLSGTVFSYAGGGGTDELTLTYDSQTLLDAAMTEGAQGTLLAVNEQTMDVSALFGENMPDDADPLGLADAMRGTSILEKVPLLSVAQLLESLQAGDALPFGFAVETPFTVSRTMSDDGTRLTRIDVSGGVARAGEPPFTITGYLRQPAGRSPKDSFELEISQDEDNYLTLSYSALRKDSVTRKEKEGEASVTTTLKATGELGGYGITTKLTVRMKNAWTADGEKLNEKITISVELSHQDKTPGRRMQRLNNVSAQSRSVICMVTTENDSDTYALTDETTLHIDMDSNSFFDGGVSLSMTVGGEKPTPVSSENIKEANADTLRELFDEAVKTLSVRIYTQLEDGPKEKIMKSLPQE